MATESVVNFVFFETLTTEKSATVKACIRDPMTYNDEYDKRLWFIFQNIRKQDRPSLANREPRRLGRRLPD